MIAKIRVETPAGEEEIVLSGAVGREIVSVISPAVGNQMVPVIYKFFVNDRTVEIPLNRIITIEMNKESRDEIHHTSN